MLTEKERLVLLMDHVNLSDKEAIQWALKKITELDETKQKLKYLCTHCKKGFVTKVEEDEPWHEEYWICQRCDSTYNKWQY